MHHLVGAVDIGGSKVAVGIVGPGGTVYARREMPSPELCAAGREGLDRVVDALAGLATGLAARLKGVGIGCTGPVDPFTGVIGRVDTIPGWNGLSLMEVFSARFPGPVAVENDADAGALAEYRLGAGRGSKRFLYVTISTGIGGGLVLDGQLYRGADGQHPEFGHHVIDASGPPCYCGARGCWETLASGPALARFHARPFGTGPALDARAVCELARQGDALALESVESVAHYLGIGLSNLATMFAPDVLALGGGVAQSWPLFESTVRRVFRATCNMVPTDNLILTPARLGGELPLAAAAEVWFSRYS